MPNDDTAFGTFNKQTKIIKQVISDGSTTVDLQTYASVDAAKNYIFTSDALTVMDECCTVLLWALHADSNGDNTELKVTFAFGTKGTPGLAGSDDWAEQYNTRKTALINAGNWCKEVAFGFTFTDSSDHLS